MPSVSLLQLQQRILSRLDGNTLLYPVSEVTAAINECLRVLNLATGIFQISTPIFTESNRIFYDVPTGILIPTRVQFEGQYLQRTFPNSAGMSNARWVTDTTTNTGMPVSRWIPCGFIKFAIHPADSIGGGQLLITGVQEPVLLANPTDTLTLPNEYTDALVLLAAQILTLKETGAIFEQASLVLNDYYRILKKIVLWRSFVQPKYFIPELVQKK